MTQQILRAIGPLPETVHFVSQQRELIEGAVGEGNIASSKVLEQAGFQEGGMIIYDMAELRRRVAKRTAVEGQTSASER